ncbi:MAG: hypothetical protein KC620_16350 [Myxococcales bacterium]|nr:hypothetical protein [Myxococcales bacterium]
MSHRIRVGLCPLVALFAVACIEDEAAPGCPGDGVESGDFCVYRQGIQETGFRCPDHRPVRYAEGPNGWAPAAPEPPAGQPFVCGEAEAPPERVAAAFAAVGEPAADLGPDAGADLGAPDASVGPGACLQVAPAVLDFGAVAVGETAMLQAQVLNACDHVVRLTEEVLEPDTALSFMLGPELPLAPVEARGSVWLAVSFTPFDDTPVNGTWRIAAENGQVLRVALVGRGHTVAQTLFRLRINNDIPESIYAQIALDGARAPWVTVTHEGAEIWMGERCALQRCGQPDPVCALSGPMVRDVTEGDFQGEITFAWDGTMSEVDAVANCENILPAPPGAYVARFCYGFQADFASEDDAGQRDRAGTVANPQCHDVAFTLPDDEVVEYALEGG